MRAAFLVLVIIGFSIAQPNTTPQNSDYLRVEWNPITSSLVSTYTIARFSNNSDTLVTQALDSIVVNGTDAPVVYFSSLPHNVPFYFRVIAENSLGRSPVSDASLGMIANNILPAVTATTNAATVSWSSQLSGATRARIKYATSIQNLLNSATYSGWNPISGGTFQIDLNNLSRGTLYYYFAIENNGSGDSYASDLKSFITEPDIHEPNNASGSATAVSLNSTLEGYIFPENDLDYYQFEMTDTSVDYELYSTNSNSFDLNIRILNFQSGEMDNFTVSASSGDTRDLLQGQEAGTYFIVVRAVSNQSDYGNNYTIQVRQKGVDLYEDNDVASRATSISSGPDYHALIQDAGDVDYYRFSQEFKGQGSVHIANAPIDLEVNVLDVNQQLIAQGQTSGGIATLHYVRYPQSTELLFLRIAALNGAEFDALQSYSFNVQTPPSPATVDVFEPNDSRSEALSIQIGNDVQSFTAFPNDSDYYAFNLPAYQSIQISMESSGSFEYDVSLLNGAGNSMEEIVTSGGSGNIIRGLTAGNYYIYVRNHEDGDFDTTHGYSLTLSAAQGDAAEPNDNFDQAWELTPGQQIITAFAYEEDVDYFKIPAAAGSTVNVQIAGSVFPVKMTVYSSQMDSLSEYKGANGTLDVQFATESALSYLLVERDTTFYDPDNFYTIVATVTEGPTLAQKRYFDGPNPFNPMVNSEGGFLFRSLLTNYRIEIYDISGYPVQTILNQSGSQQIWDGKNSNGEKVAPGVYHYLVFDNRNKVIEQGNLVLIQ